MQEQELNIFKFESKKDSDKEKKFIIANSFGKSNNLNSINLIKKNQFWALNKKYNKNKEISIEYKINKDEKDDHIFGQKFISNNRKRIRIILNNQDSKINKIKIPRENKDENIEKSFKIKLKLLEDLINLYSMFYNCSSLVSINNFHFKKLKNISRLFYGCSNLKSLPDISNWDISKVKDISYLFYGCSLLKFLPDLSNWNISEVNDMECLFCGCSSLESLPDISKWNTLNVIEMSGLFFNCSQLKKIPDISKWETNRVAKMNGIFFGCSSLKQIPDISKWNTNNLITI